MGGELVKALDAKMTLAEVGKKLNLSTTMVSRIERQALAKIALAIRSHTRKLEHAL
jgi:DNA-directed RNA polymerase specialized sigma subunit